MIHPWAVWDCEMCPVAGRPAARRTLVWKKIGAFLLKWAPGLIDAIMKQKAKEAAAKAAGQPPKQ